MAPTPRATALFGIDHPLVPVSSLHLQRLLWSALPPACKTSDSLCLSARGMADEAQLVWPRLIPFDAVGQAPRPDRPDEPGPPGVRVVLSAGDQRRAAFRLEAVPPHPE